MPESRPEDDAAFYRKHYSDWSVHELPLMVYVPSTGDREEALALVREILDEAAFDIRVHVIQPAPTPVREAENGAVCAHCGRSIVARYAGTFWKEGPMPTAWFHDQGEAAAVRWQRACGWAEPHTSPDGGGSE